MKKYKQKLVPTKQGAFIRRRIDKTRARAELVGLIYLAATVLLTLFACKTLIVTPESGRYVGGLRTFYKTIIERRFLEFDYLSMDGLVPLLVTCLYGLMLLVLFVNILRSLSRLNDLFKNKVSRVYGLNSNINAMESLGSIYSSSFVVALSVHYLCYLLCYDAQWVDVAISGTIAAILVHIVCGFLGGNVSAFYIDENSGIQEVQRPYGRIVPLLRNCMQIAVVFVIGICLPKLGIARFAYGVTHAIYAGQLDVVLAEFWGCIPLLAEIGIIVCMFVMISYAMTPAEYSLGGEYALGGANSLSNKMFKGAAFVTCVLAAVAGIYRFLWPYVDCFVPNVLGNYEPYILHTQVGRLDLSSIAICITALLVFLFDVALKLQWTPAAIEAEKRREEGIRPIVEVRPIIRMPKAAPIKLPDVNVTMPKAAPIKLPDVNVNVPKAAPIKLPDVNVNVPKAAPIKLPEISVAVPKQDPVVPPIAITVPKQDPTPIAITVPKQKTPIEVIVPKQKGATKAVADNQDFELYVAPGINANDGTSAQTQTQESQASMPKPAQQKTIIIKIPTSNQNASDEVVVNMPKSETKDSTTPVNVFIAERKDNGSLDVYSADSNVESSAVVEESSKKKLKPIHVQLSDEVKNGKPIIMVPVSAAVGKRLMKNGKSVIAVEHSNAAPKAIMAIPEGDKTELIMVPEEEDVSKASVNTQENKQPVTVYISKGNAESAIVTENTSSMIKTSDDNGRPINIYIPEKNKQQSSIQVFIPKQALQHSEEIERLKERIQELASRGDSSKAEGVANVEEAAISDEVKELKEKVAKLEAREAARRKAARERAEARKQAEAVETSSEEQETSSEVEALKERIAKIEAREEARKKAARERAEARKQGKVLETLPKEQETSSEMEALKERIAQLEAREEARKKAARERAEARKQGKVLETLPEEQDASSEVKELKEKIAQMEAKELARKKAARQRAETRKKEEADKMTTELNELKEKVAKMEAKEKARQQAARQRAEARKKAETDKQAQVRKQAEARKQAAKERSNQAVASQSNFEDPTNVNQLHERISRLEQQSNRPIYMPQMAPMMQQVAPAPQGNMYMMNGGQGGGAPIIAPVIAPSIGASDEQKPEESTIPKVPRDWEIKCPNCGKSLKINDKSNYHRCPACSKVFQSDTKSVGYPTLSGTDASQGPETMRHGLPQNSPEGVSGLPESLPPTSENINND